MAAAFHTVQRMCAKVRRKNGVHQVSTYLTQEDDTELIWFFTQDITDVIKKRDELRELNLLLDGILNNVPVYLYVKDPEDDFRYLYWNKAFAEHCKYSCLSGNRPNRL